MSTKASVLTILVVASAIYATYGHQRQYFYPSRFIACPPTLEQFMTAYSHPFDCTKFLYCVFGTLIEFRCPGEMRFHPQQKRCLPALSVKCHGPNYTIRPSTPSTGGGQLSTSFTKDLGSTVKSKTTEKVPYHPTRMPFTRTTVRTTNTAAACGRVNYITKDSGYLVSPNYPRKYFNNMNCDYNITTSPATFLKFHVHHFDLETRYDYVDIIDRSTNLHKRLTGSGKIRDIYTNTNSVQVKFHSDSHIVRSGFKIFFTATKCSGPSNYSGRSGEIVSPGFPIHYGNNLDCMYSIRTPVGTKVVLRILNFDVESKNVPGLCPKDYLKIYDGPGVDYLQLATLCGSTLPTYTYYASSNRVLMHFHTDNAVTRHGFKISYSSIPSNTNRL